MLVCLVSGAECEHSLLFLLSPLHHSHHPFSAQLVLLFCYSILVQAFASKKIKNKKINNSVQLIYEQSETILFRTHSL